MKKISYLLLLVLCGHSRLLAQQLTFQYDNAGNQVFRKWECTGCKASGESAADSTAAAAEPERASFELDTVDSLVGSISASPNPVNNTLQVKWAEVHLKCFSFIPYKASRPFNAVFCLDRGSRGPTLHHGWRPLPPRCDLQRQHYR